MKLAKLILVTTFLLTPFFSFSQTENTYDNRRHPLLTSKFILNAGVFVPSKSIKISANGSGIINEDIDFGKTFRLDNRENTFAANFIWRFSKSQRWISGIEYFSLKNRHQVSLDTEIEWEDTVYPIGADVEAGVKFNLYRLFFGYAISQGQKHEFGAGLGIHTLDIFSFIQGKAYAGDDNSIDLDRKSVSTIAPIPNIGIWYFYSPHYKWALTARIDWFAVKINEYEGSLWNIAPGLKFQAWKHIGLGLNYRFFQTSITIDKRAWDGSLNFGYSGPLFMVSTNF